MYNLMLSGVRSSYAENHLGDLFYSIVLSYKPAVVVELGSFMGYSGLHIAAALRDNKETASQFHLIDLWEDYPHRHCSMETIVRNFERNELLTLPHCKITFENQDAYQAQRNYQAGSVDLLHIDISNDGKSLERCLDIWHDKIKNGGILLFEGGSEARDTIDWMTRYDKAPIQLFIKSPWFKENYESVTFQPFPSLTFARKSR